MPEGLAAGSTGKLEGDIDVVLVKGGLPHQRPPELPCGRGGQASNGSSEARPVPGTHAREVCLLGIPCRAGDGQVTAIISSRPGCKRPRGSKFYDC